MQSRCGSSGYGLEKVWDGWGSEADVRATASSSCGGIAKRPSPKPNPALSIEHARPPSLRPSILGTSNPEGVSPQSPELKTTCAEAVLHETGPLEGVIQKLTPSEAFHRQHRADRMSPVSA